MCRCIFVRMVISFDRLFLTYPWNVSNVTFQPIFHFTTEKSKFQHHVQSMYYYHRLNFYIFFMSHSLRSYRNISKALSSKGKKITIFLFNSSKKCFCIYGKSWVYTSVTMSECASAPIPYLEPPLCYTVRNVGYLKSNKSQMILNLILMRLMYLLHTSVPWNISQMFSYMLTWNIFIFRKKVSCYYANTNY